VATPAVSSNARFATSSFVQADIYAFWLAVSLPALLRDNTLMESNVVLSPAFMQFSGFRLLLGSQFQLFWSPYTEAGQPSAEAAVQTPEAAWVAPPEFDESSPLLLEFFEFLFAVFWVVPPVSIFFGVHLTQTTESWDPIFIWLGSK
jgi:hypothetical protein